MPRMTEARPSTPVALPLFRSEAIEARRPRIAGDILLVRSLSVTLCTALAAVVCVCTTGFLIWGSYAPHSMVSGSLVPNEGLIKIYPQQAGIVLKSFVQEGMQVTQGQPLYVVSYERSSSELGASHAAVSERVIERRDSFAAEREQLLRLDRMERQKAQDEIAGLRAELAQFDKLIEAQRQRSELAAQTSSRFENLQRGGYVSSDQLNAKRADLLDQQVHLETLVRERSTLARTLGNQESELAELDVRNRSRLAELDREASRNSQELVESEVQRDHVILASATGSITAILAQVGQRAETDRPMVSIIPTGARLQATLFAPSGAIGFVSVNDHIVLRYRAFPYQQFGQYTGVVRDVARTALTRTELTGPDGGLVYDSNGTEPLYRILVELPAQSVSIGERTLPLRAGMEVDAVIQRERRRLYEWIFDPVRRPATRNAG
jgi:membrane fusion protein